MSATRRIQVIGDGRMGRALATALRAAGYDVPAIGGRGTTGAGADVVLLAVPDAQIAAAAALVEPGRLVGHLSGATGLAPLAPHEAFSLHPLLTVAEGASGTSCFAGAYAAVAGSGERSTALAQELAVALDMHPFELAEADRPAYHAAASIASNFLITLEGIAEGLAATAGVPRAALVPLIEATVRNWAALGAAAALTGPVARGDEETIAKQRAALADRTPEHLGVYDVLVTATRDLVVGGAVAASSAAAEAAAAVEAGGDRA